MYPESADPGPLLGSPLSWIYALGELSFAGGFSLLMFGLAIYLFVVGGRPGKSSLRLAGGGVLLVGLRQALWAALGLGEDLLGGSMFAQEYMLYRLTPPGFALAQVAIHGLSAILLGIGAILLTLALASGLGRDTE